MPVTWRCLPSAWLGHTRAVLLHEASGVAFKPIPSRHAAVRGKRKLGRGDATSELLARYGFASSSAKGQQEGDAGKEGEVYNVEEMRRK